MDLLLDTHAIIWFLNGDASLSLKAKAAIEDLNNTKTVSIASIWEIGIKISLDKFRFSKGFKHFKPWTVTAVHDQHLNIPSKSTASCDTASGSNLILIPASLPPPS